MVTEIRNPQMLEKKQKKDKRGPNSSSMAQSKTETPGTLFLACCVKI